MRERKREETGAVAEVGVDFDLVEGMVIDEFGERVLGEFRGEKVD